MAKEHSDRAFQDDDQERLDDAEWRLSDRDRYANYAGFVGPLIPTPGGGVDYRGREKAYECARCEGVFTETADRLKDYAVRENYYRAVMPVTVPACYCGTR